MNRSDLQKLSRVRLSEARVLLRNGRYEGAYYLSGYVVECALKACIARKTRRFDFPDKKDVLQSYSHDFDQLLRAAGLEDLHEEEIRNAPSFAKNWSVVRYWSEQKRYVLGVSNDEARSLYDAVASRPHGILLWLKKYW